MQQARLLDIPPIQKPVEPEVLDSAREHALQGLPHYWRLSWGFWDVIIEKCGYPAKVAVERLEDPSYRHRPICPFAKSEHDHDPFWERYPSGWASN